MSQHSNSTGGFVSRLGCGAGGRCSLALAMILFGCVPVSADVGDAVGLSSDDMRAGLALAHGNAGYSAQRGRSASDRALEGAAGLAPAGAQEMREPLLAAAPTATDKLVGDDAEMTRFLDQLMLAESGGRDDARNPRSTAVGPFQFIESTFLEICRRHFAAETATLGPAQILAMRKNRAFARRAAEAFTRDNAGILTANDLSPSMSNLRLAFLLGAGAAVRVLKSEPGAPLINLLGAQVVQANPFMAGMSSRDLTLWSGRNLAMQKPDQLLFANSGAKSPPAGHPAPVPGATPGSSITGATVPSMQAVAPKKVIAVTCNLDLASCRKHLALAERRLAAELSRKVVAAQSAKRSRTR